MSKIVTSIRLRDFYARAANHKIKVDDSKVFLPDTAWSKTFAAGLQKINFRKKSVIEVGVGSGVNMAGLLTSKRPPKEFLGLDISDDAVSASNAFIEKKKLSARCIISDLLKSVDTHTLSKTSDIVGCIPQVPCHTGIIETTRALSDYYEETGIKEDTFGLGLIAQLLDEVKDRAPHATVTLNIAERPGCERIDDLYESRGFEKKIIHSALVRQDAGTSLASLAAIEAETGISFHFYDCAAGRREIGAAEAETLRLAQKPIYHNLHVISAQLR